MKAFFTFVLCSLLALSGIAQTTGTVNIIFRGINKGTNNYQVMIDQTSYYSNNNTLNTPNYKITIPNLPLGTHTLKVYRLKSNDPAYNDRAQTFVYTKDFELSKGYDMNITVLTTGRVQFSEQVAPLVNNPAIVNAPMGEYPFSQLMQRVRFQRSQALKSGTVRDAFTNTNNYFSTAQIRELLSLIASESNRLELAKLSYRSVADPGNFAQLSDLFNSTSFRNEFDNYARVNTGQTSNVNTQMASYPFNQLLQSVQDKWSQSLKTTAVRDAFINTSNYFSTTQVRQLLSLISSESDRLDLVKLAYRGVIDQANFAQLSDLFNSNSFRNEFNNYVSISAGQPGNTVPIQMASYQFNQLLQSVQDKWSQSLKTTAIRDAFLNNSNYFSTTQVRQLLSLITSESDRLDLVKLAYRGVTDQANFAQLSDLFYSSNYKNEFNNYAGVSAGVSNNNTVKTQMADYQFNQLLKSVQDKWSQSLKGEAEREAFSNTNNYFSTAQIRQLLSLITLESDRLDLAKLSYRSAIDPANFGQLADLFYTASYKNEFNNYVTTQGGQVLNATVKTPMTESDFSVLVLSIRANLLQILKVSAERDVFMSPNNFFTTSQVKQLISLINAENNRLELAKLSYRSITDPENFSQLYDLFKTQASKDELANHVKNYQVSKL